MAVFAALGAPARGDGFHNAALVTKSLDEWLSDVKQAVPNLDLSGGSAEMRSGRDLSALKAQAAGSAPVRRPSAPSRGGSIDARYTPQQQAVLSRKANDCLEILAYMDGKNIYPHEFPDFQLSKIPDYRQAAKRLLRAMGPTGTRLVAGKIRQELMGGVVGLGGVLGPSDVSYHNNYYDDLVASLAAGVTQGDLSAEELQDLLNVAQAATDPERKALADKLRAAISPENMDLAALARWASQPTDPTLKQKILRELGKRISEASILDLLEARATIADSAMRRRLDAELSRRRPTYSEMQDDLAAIWQLAGSQDRGLAAAARSKVVVAFQRAPISHCLYWLGRGDSELNALIWQQVDGRIDRADSARRKEYGQTAVGVLGHDGFSTPSRKAAIEMLGRLKDRGAVDDVADELLELPRELWVETGGLLGDLTGQDFGPHEGDGITEVLEASKKWKAWQRDYGDR